MQVPKNFEAKREQVQYTMAIPSFSKVNDQGSARCGLFFSAFFFLFSFCVTRGHQYFFFKLIRRRRRD